MASQAKVAFLCAIVVFTGCACSGFMAIFCAAGGHKNELMSVLNIIILSLVFLVICTAAVIHFFGLPQSQRTKGATVLDMNSFSSEVTSDVIIPVDLCSICLSDLSEDDVRRMNCCFNFIHAPCLQDYCVSHLSTFSAAPNCPLCRSSCHVARQSV